MNDMTPTERAAISALRERGFAVAVWQPDELMGEEPQDIESFAVSAISQHLELVTDGSGEDEPNQGFRLYDITLPPAGNADVQTDRGIWVVLDEGEAREVLDRCGEYGFQPTDFPIDSKGVNYDSRIPGQLDELMARLHDAELT
jgi:hypothetical protein